MLLRWLIRHYVDHATSGHKVETRLCDCFVIMALGDTIKSQINTNTNTNANTNTNTHTGTHRKSTANYCESELSFKAYLLTEQSPGVYCNIFCFSTKFQSDCSKHLSMCLHESRFKRRSLTCLKKATVVHTCDTNIQTHTASVHKVEQRLP